MQVTEARRTQVAAQLRQAQAHTKGADTAPQQIALIRARAGVAEAAVQQARTALEQAKLNLERTTVRAPADGVVSKRTLEVGQVVQPGQALLAVTTLDDVWVVANFRGPSCAICARPAATCLGGCLRRPRLYRACRQHFRGDRRDVQFAAARQRERQFRESVVARARAHRP